MCLYVHIHFQFSLFFYVLFCVYSHAFICCIYFSLFTPWLITLVAVLLPQACHLSCLNQGNISQQTMLPDNSTKTNDLCRCGMHVTSWQMVLVRMLLHYRVSPLLGDKPQSYSITPRAAAFLMYTLCLLKRTGGRGTPGSLIRGDVLCIFKGRTPNKVISE